MKKFIKRSLLIFLVLIAFTYICNSYVSHTSKDNLYSSVELIPYNKVALVLGTAKYLKGGYPNYYFTYRIDAVTELYKAGKIEYILVSGDNSRMDYNEPIDMREALIERGVPADKIYMDFAGLRTLDSVYRTHTIFDQSTFTIVSQPFHNERAVFIAKYLGLNAIAYNAKDVNKKMGFKTNLREKFARVKVIVDRLFHVKPKYLGDKIIIGVDPIVEPQVTNKK
ncbi:SanA/YdcF family protein [Myroides pelagicus]|uniref:Vancomycin high temperature exclusion protein n=1 Tax=Myroides pelagicus TaxID=270914 RepID=A0A7K1GKE6_9FLAO|nr:ElyC/SanA/YdcF family protein [Myroides pelagicus]MEC4114305.1 ElyC/SanA/YdcF family protein [Myroides pelagicus]MTH29355.1 vancomycin high temperature exclusion protein [Myroides pelagicus]